MELKSMVDFVLEQNIKHNGDYFFVPKQPIDCETKQPTTLHPSGYFVGCVD